MAENNGSPENGDGNQPSLGLEGNSEQKAPPAAATPAPLDPAIFKDAGIPDNFIGEGGVVDLKAIASSLSEAQTLKAQAEERAKGIPEDGKYDFGLPKDFTIEGVDLSSWKAPEELTTPVASAAKELGLSQAQVSKLVSAYAAGDAAKKIARANADAQAETQAVSELGENAKTRLENLHSAVNAAGLGALLDENSTLKQRVEAFEKLINGTGKLAASNANNSGKERPDWEKLSASQLHRMAIQETARN